jgi:hypothetical protein
MLKISASDAVVAGIDELCAARCLPDRSHVIRAALWRTKQRA